MLRLLPPQSPVAGRILDHVQGHTSIGRSRNFVHLVTGHTPGRINRNGTVVLTSYRGPVQILPVESSIAHSDEVSNRRYMELVSRLHPLL